MRIVHILHRYSPQIGGAESQVAALGPRLALRGWDVHVLTQGGDGLPSRETIDGVSVHRVNAPSRGPLKSAMWTLGALGQIRRIRPQLIHAHILLSPVSIALWAKRLFGPPVVATPHGRGELGDISTLLRKPFGKARLARFRRRVDRFTSISEEVDFELAEQGVPLTARVRIPNGVDVRRFRPVSAGQRKMQRLRLELPIERGASPVFLFAGRIAPEKRLRDLLEAWPKVRSALPQAELLIAGDGPLRADLEAISPDAVHWLGRIDDVASLLQAADLFVLPSETEAFSVALLEAMATGLPIVATDVGGNVEVLGEETPRVPPANPEALAEALISTAHQASEGGALGPRLRRRVVQNFSLDVVTAQYDALYRDLLPAGEPVNAAPETS